MGPLLRHNAAAAQQRNLCVKSRTKGSPWFSGLSSAGGLTFVGGKVKSRSTGPTFHHLLMLALSTCLGLLDGQLDLLQSDSWHHQRWHLHGWHEGKQPIPLLFCSAESYSALNLDEVAVVGRAAEFQEEIVDQIGEANSPQPSTVDISSVFTPLDHNLEEREEVLQATLNSSSLQLVYLDAYHAKSNKGRHVPCTPSLCPHLAACERGFENIDSCTIDGLTQEEVQYLRAPINCPKLVQDKWLFGPVGFNSSCSHRKDFGWHPQFDTRVFRMRNVFITSKGHVFTEKFIFERNGCGTNFKFLFPEGKTRVRHFKRAISLIYQPANINFYHSLIEWLPQFFVLSHFMAAMPDVTLLAKTHQWANYEKVVQPLIGISATTFNAKPVEDDELVFVEEVYLPLYQRCGAPDLELWQLLRGTFLLPPDGLPMLGPDKLPRKTDQLDETKLLADEASDWVVIFVRRPKGRRSLENADEVLQMLRSLFPPERVYDYRASATLLEARNLFRRARFLVGGHGAGLANMVFMPINATVIEIRPESRQMACFHILAEACKLNYYLVFSHGEPSDIAHDGEYKVDIGTLTRVMKQALGS